MDRGMRSTVQSRWQDGQGCSGPSRAAFLSSSSSRVPLATAHAALLAICFMSSASRSRSAPASSWTRRATTFPQPSANGQVPLESINVVLRNGMLSPSLDFGRQANWENWVDILPGQPWRANRVLHPSDVIHIPRLDSRANWRYKSRELWLVILLACVYDWHGLAVLTITGLARFKRR